MMNFSVVFICKSDLKVALTFLMVLLWCLPAFPLLAQRPPANVQTNPQIGTVVNHGDKLNYLAGNIPEQNRVIYLGWSGAVQTEFDLNNFFHQDFTLTAWVMPQYPNAYMGPIFSNRGDGIFLAGQGEYRSGTGGWKKQGLPVFYLQVGNYKATYLLSEWQAGKWVHVAIKRWSNKFSLYINGQLKYPKQISGGQVTGTAAEIQVPAGGYSMKPQGKIQFGNSTVSPRVDPAKFKAFPNYDYDVNDFQFYGMIDDIGIFNKALHPTVINQMKYACKRLDGKEADFLAGWGFDLHEYQSDDQLPSKLQQSWKPVKAYKMPVSSDRNSTKDAKSFLNPLVIGETKVEIRLPFKVGEVWRVVQGYDSAGGSHNGYAAFSYDFTRHNVPSTPDKLVSVVAGVSGKVVSYKMHKFVREVSDKIEPNFIKMLIAPQEYLIYMHLAPNSQNGVVAGGSYDATQETNYLGNNGPIIGQNQFVGKVGPLGNHLHLSGSSQVKGGTTKPVAFANYYASDDGGNTWYPVIRGHPKSGQLIKRTQ